ncbi:MAG: hypothetical protein NZL93_06760, partial [Chthoniobacterales bacterium]|nr:hypothetical protein [Chthoniobacterales bacterium]
LGRGEEVIPVELPWRGWVLLVKPPFGVATGWAYGRLAERRQEGAERAATCEEGMLKELEWGKWLWRNDLEDAVFEKFLILRDLKEWLSGRAGVEAVMLAGSGSTVAAFSREKGALFTIVEELEREFGRVWGPAAGGMACLDGEMGFWVAVTELFG